jgi:hypothetical protein
MRASFPDGWLVFCYVCVGGSAEGRPNIIQPPRAGSGSLGEDESSAEGSPPGDSAKDQVEYFIISHAVMACLVCVRVFMYPLRVRDCAQRWGEGGACL